MFHDLTADLTTEVERIDTEVRALVEIIDRNDDAKHCPGCGCSRPSNLDLVGRRAIELHGQLESIAGRVRELGNSQLRRRYIEVVHRLHVEVFRLSPT